MKALEKIADKLEKGKWYADSCNSYDRKFETYLKFKEESSESLFFDEMKGQALYVRSGKYYGFSKPINFYEVKLSTIEKIINFLEQLTIKIKRS